MSRLMPLNTQTAPPSFGTHQLTIHTSDMWPFTDAQLHEKIEPHLKQRPNTSYWWSRGKSNIHGDTFVIQVSKESGNNESTPADEQEEIIILESIRQQMKQWLYNCVQYTEASKAKSSEPFYHFQNAEAWQKNLLKNWNQETHFSAIINRIEEGVTVSGSYKELFKSNSKK